MVHPLLLGFSAHCLPPFSFSWPMHLRVTSSSWLARSVCPLDWGWKPHERLTVASRAWQNSFQTREINSEPRSGMMLEGIPCKRKTWVTMRSAVFFPEGSLVSAMKCTDLENISTTVRMVVLPLEGGRPVTKFKAIYNQGWLGTGSGLSNPAGGRSYFKHKPDKRPQIHRPQSPTGATKNVNG